MLQEEQGEADGETGGGRRGKRHKGWGPRGTGRPLAGRRCRATQGGSAGAEQTTWTQYAGPWRVLNSLGLSSLNFKMGVRKFLSRGIVTNTR